MTQIDITRLQDSIDALAQALTQSAGSTSGAVGSVTRNLRSAAQSFAGVKTAADEVSATQERLAMRSRAYENAIEQTVSTIKSLATGAVSATQALYGASGAFSAAAAGTDTAIKLLQNGLQVLGDFAMGFGKLGIALKVGAEGAAIALGLFNQALNFQLQAMQTQVDTFINLSRQGATFGGSLANLINAVGITGVPMREFSALVSASAQDLSNMGLGMSGAASMVIDFTKKVSMNNRELVGMYGNFQELAQNTAQYLALQTQLGMVDVSNQAKQKEGITDYLRRQKELSDMLGKSTKTMADEEARRRANLGYQTELANVSRNNTAAAGNIQTITQLFGKMGSEFGDMAEQLFVGRDAMSAQSRKIFEQFPVLGRTIEQLSQASRTMTEADFREFSKNLVTANKSAIEQEQQERARLFGPTAYQATNAQVQLFGRLTAGIAGSMQALDTFGKTVAGVPVVGETDAERAEQQRRINATNAIIQQAENKRLELQGQLDIQIANRFSEMVKIVEAGFKVQELQVKTTNVILDTGLAAFNAAANLITGTAPPAVPSSDSQVSPAAAASTPSSPPAAAPATRPEPPRPGPPAVPAPAIPVSRSVISEPLAPNTSTGQIDLLPVVDVLQGMKRAIEDTRNINERMLRALA